MFYVILSRVEYGNYAYGAEPRGGRGGAFRAPGGWERHAVSADPADAYVYLSF